MKAIGNEEFTLSPVAYKIFTKFQYDPKPIRSHIVYIRSLANVFAEIDCFDDNCQIIELENALFELKLNGNITDFSIFKDNNSFSFW